MLQHSTPPARSAPSPPWTGTPLPGGEYHCRTNSGNGAHAALFPGLCPGGHVGCLHLQDVLLTQLPPHTRERLYL